MVVNLFYCCCPSQGGFDYKKAIVDTIITVIEENSEAKEAGNYVLLTLSSKSCSVHLLFMYHIAKVPNLLFM